MVGGGRAIGWEEKEHHWGRARGLLVTLSQAWQLLPFLGRQSGVITGQIATTYHLSDPTWGKWPLHSLFKSLNVLWGGGSSHCFLPQGTAGPGASVESYLSPVLCSDDTAVGKTSTSAFPA